MSTDLITQMLTTTVEELSEAKSLEGLFHQHRDGDPLPSSHALEEIIELSRAILFPGYFGKSTVSQSTLRYHVGVNVERLHKLLADQIMAGLCFSDCADDNTLSDRTTCRCNAEQLAANLLAKYPAIRSTLATDVEAAYNGDPAAENFGEIISCYPIIKTLVNYRIAHELLLLGVPLIPRIITEMAHSETGIDIHPAAQIGHHFTIDHGTGVVIGATCIIGNNVKLYQGVTLGAKSFPLDANGNPIKGIPRHPILEDNVIVYSNATILGRITIGEGCVVGANLWITRDMAPRTKKYKQEKTDFLDIVFDNGTGI
ncbi:MAG: serine acetyltransferase [Prevotella sp.]|nr:serine acetyltransferase [Prevotella sp.]